MLPREQMVRRLCSGLAEEEPVVLVSRRTALVKDFLAQSFSVRLNDAMAQKLSWVMAAGAVACAIVAGAKGQGRVWRHGRAGRRGMPWQPAGVHAGVCGARAADAKLCGAAQEPSFPAPAR